MGWIAWAKECEEGVGRRRPNREGVREAIFFILLGIGFSMGWILLGLSLKWVVLLPRL